MIKQTILLATLSFTAFGFACSCTNFDVTEAHISNAEVIFKGTITSVISCELETDVKWRTKSVKMYTFKVSKAFKGIDKECVEIVTGNPFGGCGDHFYVGKEYVVFANDSRHREKNKGIYETSICMGNGLASDYEDYMEILMGLKSGEAIIE